MTNTTAEQNDAKTNHSNDVDGVHAAELTASRMGAQVGHELGRARKAATKLATRVTVAAKEHPRTTAAVLFGTGALVGALVYRVIFPRPTAGQVIARALRSGASNTGRSLMSGLKSAQRMVS